MTHVAAQGKYMEILFDKQNKIMGGRTTKYLLEKVRAIMCNVCYLKLY